MNGLFVLTAILAVTQGLPLSVVEEQWKNFKVTHGKQYANEAEENTRKQIFANNLQEFEEHNKKYEAGLVSYKKGVTRFADMTHEEFMKTLTPINLTGITEGGRPFVPPVNVKLPNSVDWRKENVVTPVKAQGNCGSCYAFSGVGAIESHLAIKTSKLVSLSEQNIVDCSWDKGNNGCDGGNQANVFQYVKDNSGIDTEKSYPYEGKEGDCRYNTKSSGGTVSDFVVLPSKDESALQSAVATAGPVSVAVNGSPLHGYVEGVIEGDCNPNNLTHGVLVIGYDTTSDGKAYWIVKNSWGKGFGEDGYFRLARNKNECGVADFATYPVV